MRERVWGGGGGGGVRRRRENKVRDLERDLSKIFLIILKVGGNQL